MAAKFSEKIGRSYPADFFIYGHFHVSVRQKMPSGATLVVLKDWIGGGSPHALFDTASGTLTILP